MAEGEAHAGPVQPENGSVQVQCYGCSYTGNIQTVSFQMYTVNAYKVTESGEMYSIDDETSIADVSARQRRVFAGQRP